MLINRFKGNLENWILTSSRIISIAAILVLLGPSVIGQPQNPPPPDPDTPVPLTGTEFLLAAGVGYGIKKMLDRRRLAEPKKEV
jgi:hypothetical protein